MKKKQKQKHKPKQKRKEKQMANSRKREKTADNALHEYFSSRERELRIAFSLAVKNIPLIYTEYGIHDIAASLFVSFIWLPNISSSIKHQLLATILASMKPEEFKNLRQISTYEEFCQFLNKLHAVLPTFDMAEDYVPEPDWGDVKFYHDGNIYRIFYGQELSNLFEYLILFQMLYLPFDEQYLKYTGRSPSSELEYCLSIQNEIISGIKWQPSLKEFPQISPGYIEVPPKLFWEKATEFYENYDVRKKYSETFITNYSIKLWSAPLRLDRCG